MTIPCLQILICLVNQHAQASQGPTNGEVMGASATTQQKIGATRGAKHFVWPPHALQIGCRGWGPQYRSAPLHGCPCLAYGLPGPRELRTERVAQEVHQGLQFMYRSNSDKMGGWQSDLGRLSGGERTLVSLALILAAATAGAKSSLFLMDEVDAALDENNQALVATLIKEIMAQSGGCQIMCVTHNLAFQQICSSIIQVAKDKHGATIVLDSVSAS
ncbi:TPA: hypothetical protein ACH3X3_003102 [Trebouxia sp. C0006]